MGLATDHIALKDKTCQTVSPACRSSYLNTYRAQVTPLASTVDPSSWFKEKNARKMFSPFRLLRQCMMKG